MLSPEQKENVTRFAGKRHAVRAVIEELRLCDPKSSDYTAIYNEVAAVINRNIEIAIRVTSVEYDQLTDRAKKTRHKRTADFIRSAALGATITTPPPVQIVTGSNNTLELRNIARALQSISNSVNQLSLRINVEGKHHRITQETADRYADQLEQFLSELKRIEVPHNG